MNMATNSENPGGRGPVLSQSTSALRMRRWRDQNPEASQLGIRRYRARHEARMRLMRRHAAEYEEILADVLREMDLG